MAAIARVREEVIMRAAVTADVVEDTVTLAMRLMGMPSFITSSRVVG